MNDIIKSRLAGTHSFIESLTTNNHDTRKLFTIDMVKSRKNAMYYNKYDYCLFTVMDSPVKFYNNMSHTKPGLYFIETELYFPIRGNGWYSHVMVDYLIKK